MTRLFPAHRLFAVCPMGRSPMRPSPFRVPGGKERRRMNNRICCNEYEKYGKAKQNSIEYCFVSTDGNTASHIHIGLGDIDPFTGNPLNDPELFREYHAIRNRQVYCNGKQLRIPYTKKEKADRCRLCDRIAKDFEDEFGYAPNSPSLDWLLEEKWPIRHVFSLDSMMDEDETMFSLVDTYADSLLEEDSPEESEDTEALREFARSLSGRLADVYQMLLIKTDAGADQPCWYELADKWGVTSGQISRDKKKIIRMIRKYSEQAHCFSYDRCNMKKEGK